MPKISVDIKELQKLLSKSTLLYVEDNLGLKEKASHLFKKLFPRVIEAKDGQEGLELFKTHRPDFVITDIQMPHLNGIQMAQEIRKIDNDTKIIITSAFDEKEYLLQSIEIKVDGYLVKPIQVDKITQVLYDIAKVFHEEKQKEVFNSYLHSIFNHQENLIIMFKERNAVLANDHVLKFFDCKSIAEFRKVFETFNALFLPHDSFLYPNIGRKLFSLC